MKPGHVIQSIDAPSIYQVPLNMEGEKLDEMILNHFHINDLPAPDFTNLKGFLDKLYHPKHQVDIALVGKYVELQDAYKSILESFVHAGAANECKVIHHCRHVLGNHVLV